MCLKSPKIAAKRRKFLGSYFDHVGGGEEAQAGDARKCFTRMINKLIIDRRVETAHRRVLGSGVALVIIYEIVF